MNYKNALTIAFIIAMGCINLSYTNAEVIWSEDFEIKEKVLDSWKEEKYDRSKGKVVQAPGIIILDQSRKVKGKQSARIIPDVLNTFGGGDMEIKISCELPANEGGVLTVWIYDYNESYAYYSGVEISGGEAYNKLKLYVAASDPNFVFREHGTPGHGGSADIPRKTAWRKLQFVLDKVKTKGKVRAYIDGRLIGESKRNFKSFKKLSLGAVIGMLRFWPLFFDAISLDDDPESIEKDLYRGVDLNLSTDKLGNVFHSGDNIKIKVKIQNYGDIPKSIKISGKVFDSEGNFIADTPNLSCELAAGKIEDLILKFPDPGKKGPMFVVLNALENEKVICNSKIGIGMIENPAAIKADKSSIVDSHLITSRASNFIDIGFTSNRLLGVSNRNHTWPSVEPEKGKFNWKETDHDVDDLLNKYKYPDIMYCFHSTPLWATDAGKSKKISGETHTHHAAPSDMKDWGNYVGKTVARYKDKVKYWEIWNEVNTLHFRGTSEQYFQLLKTAYEAIKKADPEAKVIGITCSSIDLKFMEKIFKLGGLKYIDILGIHPYPHNKPEKTALKKILALKKLMAKHGEIKPIWDTEFGFYTAGVGEDERPKNSKDIANDKAMGLVRFDWINSDIDVANWSARLMIIYLANGFEKVFYHGGHPMVHSNSMAKYFTYSMAECAQELSGSKFIRKIDLGDDNLHAYLFEKNKKYIAALWAVSGKENINLKVNSSEYQVADIWGNVENRKAPGDTAELLLTESPIYLKGIGANIAPVAKNFSIEIPPIVLKPDFKIKVHLKNPESKQLSGKIFLKVPKGWGVKPETIKLEVPGNATKQVDFNVKAASDVYKGKWPIQAQFVSADGKSSLQDNAKIATLIPVPCSRLKKALSLDGNHSDWPDWENAPKIDDKEQLKLGMLPTDDVILRSAIAAGQSFWEGKDDLSAVFQMAWDDKFLYIAVKMRDDEIRNQHPANPYFGDCLEFFIDPRGSKSRSSNKDPNKVFQLLFAPSVNGDKKPKVWLCSKGVVDIKTLTPKICAEREISEAFTQIEYASKTITDGYLVELKIPFALFEFQKPKPGDSFGFDLAIDDQDQANKKRESQLFWVGDQDNHKNPSRFGVIQLEK